MLKLLVTSAGLLIQNASILETYSRPGADASIVINNAEKIEGTDYRDAQSELFRHNGYMPTPGTNVLLYATGPVQVSAWRIRGTEGGCPLVWLETMPIEVAECASPITIKYGGPGDINCDGDVGTDKDIEDFWKCIGGNCCKTCTADFNNDGDIGTDADIEAFYAVLGGHING
jgi:hypothetical protein